ncbi:MAG: hypothetical protein U0M42_04405 [Acutalibacteraceae bacterium]|nr:hypothetical protein [Acutalibacteraceae bacterium]
MNWMKFVEYLPYMGKGMLAILIVIGIIILVTGGLNKFINNTENKK